MNTGVHVSLSILVSSVCMLSSGIAGSYGSSIFIICSIAAAAMFFLFYRDLNSFTIKQTEEPIAKKQGRWRRKGMTEDEMAGWHHQLDGHESE